MDPRQFVTPQAVQHLEHPPGGFWVIGEHDRKGFQLVYVLPDGQATYYRTEICATLEDVRTQCWQFLFKKAPVVFSSAPAQDPPVPAPTLAPGASRTYVLIDGRTQVLPIPRSGPSPFSIVPTPGNYPAQDIMAPVTQADASLGFQTAPPAMEMATFHPLGVSTPVEGQQLPAADPSGAQLEWPMNNEFIQPSEENPDVQNGLLSHENPQIIQQDGVVSPGSQENWADTAAMASNGDNLDWDMMFSDQQ